MLLLFKSARVGMSSMHLSPQMVLKKLQKVAPENVKALITPDEKNNTLLHHAAHKHIDAFTFNKNMDCIGHEAAAAMAKTVNCKGEIPLKIAKGVFFYEPTHIIPKTLFALTRQYHSEDEVFSRKDVLEQYTDKSLSKAARENLTLACNVIEKVQEYNIASVTYPSVNNMSCQTYLSLTDQMHKMRKIVTNTNIQIINAFPMAAPPVMMMARQLAHLNNETSQALAFKTGNCFEYAMLGMYLFFTQYQKTCAEFYQLIDGDHTFLVIGRDKSGDAARAETFGEDAVVCDVHTKRAYLATELPEKMMGWTHAALPPGTSKELTAWTRTSYNPSYHSLNMAFSLTENQLYRFKI